MTKDHLFRVSLKAVIRDAQERVLVVKEKGHRYWGLPGGGMDHGELYEQALARELHEEVGYRGKFTSRLIGTGEPGKLPNRDAETWQIRLVFEVVPENYNFISGKDAEGIEFVSREEILQNSDLYERLIYTYCV